MNLLRNVVGFYVTVGVPVVYGLGLWLIVNGEKMNLPSGMQLIGLIGAMLGIVVWILSYIYLGKSFGVLPRTQKKISRGIYGYVRHPMYKGIMLTYLGLSMANQSYTGAWYSLFVMFPMLYIRARFEDKYLKK